MRVCSLPRNDNQVRVRRLQRVQERVDGAGNSLAQRGNERRRRRGSERAKRLRLRREEQSPFSATTSLQSASSAKTASRSSTWRPETRMIGQPLSGSGRAPRPSPVQPRLRARAFRRNPRRGWRDSRYSAAGCHDASFTARESSGRHGAARWRVSRASAGTIPGAEQGA